MKVYVTNENNRLLRTLNDGVDLTKWINDQIARGYISSGVSTLASLTDVNLTGVQPDYVLTYDAVTSKWVPKFNAATGGLPAGSDGQIQFNNNGAFGASSNLFWDNTNGRLVINRPTIPSSSFSVTGTTGNNDIITIRDNQDRTRLSIPNSNDRIILGHGFGNIDFAGTSSAQHIRVASSASPMDFRGRGVTAASGYSFRFFTAEPNNLSGAAGTETGLFQMKDLQFNPSTQSANYSLLNLNTTINQTGGSNGITRALWINPTLTSAANFRSIQFDNNTGWGLYGNGTANNYLAGRLAVGTTDTGSSKVTIQGEGATSANSALSILNSNSISLLHVRNDGLVGIGTNNPGFSLDVAGRTRTQQLTVTGGNAILTDNGRVVIGGTTIDNSALLNVQSTTRGFLMPRMTTTEKNAILSPATGLQVYDTTLNQINVYNGTAWVGVGSSTVRPVATVTATAGTIPAINLESAGTGIYEINMTNAGVSATFNAPTNPVNGGVYTFRFTNVTSHAIDFPSTFLDQTGSLFDGGTSYQINVGDFITGYFNGTNYICGKGTNVAGNNTEIQYNNNGVMGASSKFRWRDDVRSIFIESLSVPDASLNGSNLVTGKNFSIWASLTDNNGTSREILSFRSSGLILNNGTTNSPIVFNQHVTEAMRIAATTSHVAIGMNNPTARLHVRSSGATSGTTGLLVQNSTPIDTFRVFDNGLIRLNKNTAVATQSSAQIDVESVDTNTNIVLTPKGTGAFILGPAPDGTVTGGNARGANAVDLQDVRTNANQVASGIGAVLAGGYNNRSSETRTVVSGGEGNSAINGYAVVSGGTGNSASGSYSRIGGGRTNQSQGEYSSVAGGWNNIASNTASTVSGGSTNTASGSNSVVSGGSQNSATGSYSTTGGGNGVTSTADYATASGGLNNTASANSSTVIGGRQATAYLFGQVAHASGRFVTSSDNQTSNIRLRNIIANSTTELFLDGSSSRAVLTAPSGGTVRLWNAYIQCIAVIANAGTSALTAGSCISQHYELTIKRTATATTLVGTPNRTTNTNDPHMSTADFLITADAANNSLKIEFQPPNGSTADMQIRAVATVYLTEIGY